MNLRAIFLLSMALLMAIFAVMLAKRLINQAPTTAQVSPPLTKVSVIFAAQEIPYLTIIEDVDLNEHQLPADSLPMDIGHYFSRKDELIGKVSIDTVHAGTPLVRPVIRDREDGHQLAIDIRPHFRAMSLRVDDVRGVGGFLLRGNLVDVLASSSTDDKQPPEAHYIAQAVRVLAVDQEVSHTGEKPIVVKAVTLELTPSQSEDLAKAQLSGSIQLLLRNPEDTTSSVLHRDPISPVRKDPPKKSFTIISGQSQGGAMIVECEQGQRCP